MDESDLKKARQINCGELAISQKYDLEICIEHFSGAGDMNVCGRISASSKNLEPRFGMRHAL